MSTSLEPTVLGLMTLLSDSKNNNGLAAMDLGLLCGEAATGTVPQGSRHLVKDQNYYVL